MLIDIGWVSQREIALPQWNWRYSEIYDEHERSRITVRNNSKAECPWCGIHEEEGMLLIPVALLGPIQPVIQCAGCGGPAPLIMYLWDEHQSTEGVGFCGCDGALMAGHRHGREEWPPPL